MANIRRRVITFPALGLAWVLLVASAPITLPLGVVIGLLRKRRFIIARMTAFAIVYSTLEFAGLVLAGLAALRHPRDTHEYLEAHYRLQLWWANALFGVARRLLQLELHVEGAHDLAPGPILLLSRHASLADSLLPAALVTAPAGIRLRYVLKKELLVDPCLDVVGNRLPNHFIDRAQPTEADLRAIRALAANLGPRDGVVIYPEGTRFTDLKRKRVLQKMRDKGSPYLATAMTLRHSLPPRIGGVAELVEAAPQADLVFCAHTGFEGFATFTDLLSGDVVGRCLRVKFWRIPSSDVPNERDELACWLYERWKEVDAFVGANLSTGMSTGLSPVLAGGPSSPSDRAVGTAASSGAPPLPADP